jgi:uncharacterized membrane protein
VTWKLVAQIVVLIVAFWMTTDIAISSIIKTWKGHL